MEHGRRADALILAVARHSSSGFLDQFTYKRLSPRNLKPNGMGPTDQGSHSPTAGFTMVYSHGNVG